MKKKIYYLFVFALIIFSVLSFNNNSLTNVLAQEPSVTSISSTLNYIDNDLEVSKNNGIYQITKDEYIIVKKTVE